MSISNGGPPIDSDDAPNIRVIRIHINDWVASTRGMSLDEEGFFWRFTCLFYDRMGTVPDDDYIVSRAMNLDIRVYKKFKARMVALGKITSDERRLTNARAEREINNYLREYKRRSEAAKQREEGKRSAQRSAGLPADFRQTSGELPLEVRKKSDELPSLQSTDLFKKTKENNGCNATTVPQGDHSPHARARPKPKPKPISEVPPIAPQGGRSPLELAFEEFWKAFPGEAPPLGRKTDKPKAWDVFKRIATGTHRKGLKASVADLIDAAKAYRATNPDPQFTPMPTTWLNGARWQRDAADVAPLVSPDGKVKWGWWRGLEDRLRAKPVADWRKAVETLRPNGTWPWWVLTAAPGDPECLMPQELIDEYGFAEKYRGQITSQQGH